MIPFSPPRMDQKNLDEVNETLMSGWITTGPRTKLLEKRITEYVGSKSTLCLSSATAGLELMLRWYGVGPGDEVIVPAYTYSATGNVVLHTGAKLVLVDAGSDFNIDVEKVREAISPNTKVIMPVDIGGYPVDYDGLKKLIEEKKEVFTPKSEEQQKLGRILLLSDSAHAFGAVYRGQKVGSISDIHCFSFHAVKNLSTAEGGAVCLNLPEPFDNQEVYDFLCVYSLHGQNKDALAKTKKGNWRYDIIVPGFKCNMTDLSAALGLVELERYDSETLPRRKAIVKAYHDHFSQKDWAEVPPLTKELSETSYHLYMLRIRGVDELKRDQMIQGIFDRDVSVNVHFQPLPLFTAYRSRGFNIDDYPKAMNLYCREISLPVYYNLSDGQVATVIEAVTQSVESNL